MSKVVFIWRGRPTIEMLGEIQVSTLAGGQVPLGQIANPHFQTAPNEIRRYARERVVTVKAWPGAHVLP